MDLWWGVLVRSSGYGKCIAISPRQIESVLILNRIPNGMLLFELVIIQSNFAIGCSDQDPPVFYLDISDPV